ncbi:hypothetical protein FDA09_10370 [Clostridium botulinum]|uniref:hypothetical protein n=1 Tax=Clostridium botulinum TaxID=1491 RepID=UPI00077430EE|nr:hypothetical protein [Clostridium botulinum]NFH80315.1 hypothetical protein [Clostridium botulinum]NFH83720.1 hypothetical protein [Clostridium botulinum]NFI11793.1 hypothetical protein [Clostridium botulinum]NFI16229.1 hypothetical protein [Clostridium botulinum]NFO84254.1 hypothetical protein [Clostridium botulinum]
MKELEVLNQKDLTIKSTKLVEIINEFRKVESEARGEKYIELQHYDFMKKIKKEIKTLESLGLCNEGNISVVEYIDKKGEKRPCFELNASGMRMMLNAESTLVRYKTEEYISNLEDNIKNLAIENYKLKLELQEREMSYLQDKAKLSQGLLYAHNTINAEHGVGQSYMPQIIIDILNSVKDKIIKQDDNFYFFNAENVKEEFMKYEINPKRFKELLETLGGCKSSIYITGRNKRNYRYECYAAPKYLIDCKL